MPHVPITHRRIYKRHEAEHATVVCSLNAYNVAEDFAKMGIEIEVKQLTKDMAAEYTPKSPEGEGTEGVTLPPVPENMVLISFISQGHVYTKRTCFNVSGQQGVPATLEGMLRTFSKDDFDKWLGQAKA